MFAGGDFNCQRGRPKGGPQVLVYIYIYNIYIYIERDDKRGTGDKTDTRMRRDSQMTREVEMTRETYALKEQHLRCGIRACALKGNVRDMGSGPVL